MITVRPDSDPDVLIEIDGRSGKWIRFIQNPNNKTLRRVYQHAIDVSPDLTPSEKTSMRNRQIT